MLHVLCIRSVYTLLNQDTQSISSEPLSGLNYLRLADVPLALYSVRSGMSALPISNGRADKIHVMKGIDKLTLATQLAMHVFTAFGLKQTPPKILSTLIFVLASVGASGRIQ